MISDPGVSIRFDHVWKAFAGRGRVASESIFEDFSLVIRPGELVALVGMSGTGKTTLLNLAAGLEKTDRGTVLTTGGRSSRIGMVFQQPRLLDWISVRRNVLLAALHAGQPETYVDELLDAVGLTPYAHKYPSVLSGGQRQRVAVARAFVINPDIILLDEPFSALDEFTARKLRLLLQGLLLRRETTGLLVTHNPLEAAFLADRVLTFAGRPVRVEAERIIAEPRPRLPEDMALFEIGREITAELVGIETTQQQLLTT